MKHKSLFIALLLPVCLNAQGSIASGESVEINAPYATKYPARNLGSDVPASNAPISLIKPADALVLHFSLFNNSGKQEIRNKDLSATLDAIVAVISKTPGLRIETREVRLAGADRKYISVSSSATTSSTQLAIYADLTSEHRPYDRAKQIRALLDTVRFAGDTTLNDGPAMLFVRNPASYRRELLDAIFADIAYLQKKLGDGFEILPTGLDQPIKIRAASESEIELYISYSFTIRSLRNIPARVGCPVAPLKQ
ncbi:hypothetical protein M2103_000259 [Ereboglobus sp. PH5-5]|uniref:hypothetical protein n=1 Tax=Ereboglobus sp. PH5-5 TaxID=2940529 RepID=UPI002405A3FB|nr:hypothetical protein [Ereboglobus sp. PH5-5]MDF9832051.1 hypothetical protein [Ereboglobus sp. PH5-5]